MIRVGDKVRFSNAGIIKWFDKMTPERAVDFAIRYWNIKLEYTYDVLVLEGPNVVITGHGIGHRSFSVDLLENVTSINHFSDTDPLFKV